MFFIRQKYFLIVFFFMKIISEGEFSEFIKGKQCIENREIL